MNTSFPDELRVADVMHAGIVACTPETPLDEVAELMAERRIHCVVVREDPGGDRSLPWRIVSDLDLAAMIAARNMPGGTAGASAATPVVIVSQDEPLRRAAQLMVEHNTAHLVVVDLASGEPVGVVSTLDLARVAAHSQGEPAASRR